MGGVTGAAEGADGAAKGVTGGANMEGESKEVRWESKRGGGARRRTRARQECGEEGSGEGGHGGCDRGEGARTHDSGLVIGRIS